MRSFVEVAELILQNQVKIIENLEDESIAVYEFLQREYKNGRVDNNKVFQFVYRSFFRLDNAGLSKTFKTEYFSIMEEHRGSDCISAAELVKRLYQHRRLKGDNSIQFSFVTKLINTIRPHDPIYDSEVAKVFGFRAYYGQGFDKRLNEMLKQYNYLKVAYSALPGMIGEALALFDNRFKGNRLCTSKKLDFIIWSAGKLMIIRQS